jgi:uncharacterized protein
MKRLLKVKVQPEASEDRLVVRSADSFLIRVRQPPESGRANRAMLALLAAHLGVPPRRLWIVKGAHSPAKIVEVRSPGV